MHLWLHQKQTKSTHQELAFDCAIIVSSTCFIIWILSSSSGDLFILYFKCYMDHLSLLYPLHIYYFKGISRINFLLEGPRWLCLIEWNLCECFILMFQCFRYQEKEKKNASKITDFISSNKFLCWFLPRWWCWLFQFHLNSDMKIYFRFLS